MYAFVERCGGNAVIIFRFDDTDKAIAVLSARGFQYSWKANDLQYVDTILGRSNMKKCLAGCADLSVSRYPATTSLLHAGTIKIGGLFAVTGPASISG